MALGGLLASGWWLWRWRQPWGRATLFALASFVVLMAPMLGFFEQGFYAYALVADHWLYLALPVTCAWGAGLLGSMAAQARYRHLALVTGALLSLWWGIASWHRSGTFVSDEAAWRATVRQCPGTWLAHLNLANDLARRGADDEALEHYRRVLESRPEDVTAHYNLAQVLARQDQRRAAATHLAKACLLRPTAEWLLQLGQWLAQEQQFKRATVCFQQAIQLAPGSAAAAQAKAELERVGSVP
jgi:tetratricopeptide (TPR) repeat protein